MFGRLRLRALLVLLAVGASLFAFARPASASTDEDYFINAINQIRVSRGLGALAVNGQLTAVARSWSQHMSADGNISHNPNLGSQVTGWHTLGENVGTGGDDSSIEAAFEASPHHFENMVDPAFTEIGVGVVQDSSGTYWVTEDYEQPKAGASAAPAPRAAAPKPPAPKPVAKPAPKPVSAPKPAPAPVHATAAAPAPAPTPVATTVAPAPPATVPLAVLGSSVAKPAGSNRLGVPNPFTVANLTGLVALVVLGASMAMFARVRVRVARPGSAISG
jgi:hypothetical protein